MVWDGRGTDADVDGGLAAALGSPQTRRRPGTGHGAARRPRRRARRGPRHRRRRGIRGRRGVTGEEPGWERLLVAARRSLERTGGRLDGRIGLADPTDAERRVVIGLTGRHRPPGTGAPDGHPGRDRRGAAPHAWRAAGGRAQPHGAAAARPARRACRRGRRARHGARRRAEPGARRRGVVRGLAGRPGRRRHPHPPGPARRTAPRRAGRRRPGPPARRRDTAPRAGRGGHRRPEGAVRHHAGAPRAARARAARRRGRARRRGGPPGAVGQRRGGRRRPGQPGAGAEPARRRRRPGRPGSPTPRPAASRCG